MEMPEELDQSSRDFWRRATDWFHLQPEEVSALRDVGFLVCESGAESRPAGPWDVAALLDCNMSSFPNNQGDGAVSTRGVTVVK